ncbi:hypothetical protein HAX54_013368 [Datura stramonium]|uniref:5'-3' exonuclease alpha-helical arch N-terminal domain-containing protein n=1 Tax=Datura stramonium TaxID=4076 RepID=A0ABS8TL74_DATST|nr:hypothetical protein [Datura stramonium]
MQVVKIESHEADDVIATLVEQVLQRGHRVVVASPDKDFKQLISDDVQIVMPVPEFNRWSFYTLKHYVAQYNCDPRSDLSLSKVLISLFTYPAVPSRLRDYKARKAATSPSSSRLRLLQTSRPVLLQNSVLFSPPPSHSPSWLLQTLFS